MQEFTIQGIATLPSLGKIYGKGINPNIELRSMTTNDEMKRLNHSDKPYKIMSEIIDDCMIEKCPISCYDMSIADYQYLLHKLRVVTYGADYKVTAKCPYCGTISTITIDLESLVVKQFDEEKYKKYSELDLPRSCNHIKLRMQTPRLLDNISSQVNDQKRKTPDMVGDSAFLFTIESLIQEIDGEKPDPIKLPQFVRNLPMMDTNYIFQYSQKLTGSFGIDNIVAVDCSACGLQYDTTFRTTSEFFGPSIDI